MTPPRTRASCIDGPRPCPWVTCRYHLGEGTSLRAPRPLDKLTQSCALDVAQQGGLTLSEVGELLGITRERARQIETSAMAHLRENAAALHQELLSP